MVWTTTGTRARRAAMRPSRPALLLWVCTIDGFTAWSSLINCTMAMASTSGLIGRRRADTVLTGTPMRWARSCRSPSGEVSGPATNSVSKRSWSSSAQQRRTVSWAPPTDSLVTMLTTLTGGSPAAPLPIVPQVLPSSMCEPAGQLGSDVLADRATDLGGDGNLQRRALRR